MATQNNQFRKDVLKAKAKYRKRRKLLILSVMSMVLAVTLIQTYMYIREKKQISNQLTEQNNTIAKLDKENKVNELVIDKLKDPYFISDLVRQEYGLSYKGEIIFNLPLQESFLQTTIKSIMDGNLQKVEDNHGRIDDSKIPELSKEDKDKKTSSGKDNKSKNKDTDNKDEKNTSEQNTTRQTTNPNTNNQRGNRG
ncbi:FtsB family cell division protein [Gemella morbillorum]|jgi:septum formation initiator family protein|uniref:FtsB family cell division protein n=1 Tax=Gemella morbillorum TaxID=29391 RepID=UPI00254F48E1|nr:septum formation initiator family protein [Gemella morbillorum]MDK8239236.1 septum formation initiator family protein [Gemella morbillorum]MDK8254501.1 septum formation initiator family protein [Gemella morbillorum]